MKKFLIFLLVISTGVILQSCEKAAIENNLITEKVATTDFEEGIIEDADDDAYDNHKDDYQAEASGIVSVGLSDTLNNQGEPIVARGNVGHFENCSTYKYAGAYCVGVAGDDRQIGLEFTMTDDILPTSIVCNSPQIHISAITKVSAKKYKVEIDLIQEPNKDPSYTFKAKKTKFTVNQGGKTYFKTIPLVSFDLNGSMYMTRMWGLNYEVQTNAAQGFSNFGQTGYHKIEANYVARKGDLLIRNLVTTDDPEGKHVKKGSYFAHIQKEPVVKNGSTKIRIIEYNSLCDNKRRFKTVSYQNISDIKGITGLTATHYTRF